MSTQTRLERAMLLWLDHRRAPACDDAAFLASHPDLHEFLTPLLASSDDADAADADASAGDDDTTANQEPTAAATQRVFGDYQVLRELGRGGMGVVYEARQLSLGRLVALKIASPGAILSTSTVARMLREARTLARLDHPNIVKVVGVLEGSASGYAMERIDGTAIDATPRPLRVLVEMLAQVADAIHYAHTAGVLHRDIKPGNILVRADGSPVVTDFGLSRDSDLPSLTQTGAFAGTPYYVSPEQARGLTIDGRSDVFSLGVTLYELIAGRRPFLGGSTQSILESIQAGDVPDPRRLRSGLPRELAAVALKAIAPRPEHRYPTAAALGADLRAWLDGAAVGARMPSRPVRAWRWCRRHPVSAAVTVVASIALAVVVALSVAHERSLRTALTNTADAERAEREAKGKALARLWQSYVDQASALRSSGRIGQRDSALQAIADARDLQPDRSPAQTAELRRAAIASLARPDIRLLRRWQLPRGTDQTTLVTADIDRTGTRLARALATGAVVVRSIHDDTEIGRIEGRERVVATSFGRGDAGGDGTSTLLAVQRTETLTVSRLAADGGLRTLVTIPGAGTYGLSHDGAHCAVELTDGARHLYSLATGERLRMLERGPGSGAGRGGIEFAPDGRLVAIPTTGGTIDIADVTTGTVVRSFAVNGDEPAVAWRPDGNVLAIGPTTAGISLFDVKTGALRGTLSHRGGGMRLAFQETGDLLVSNTWWDGAMMVFSTATARPSLSSWWVGRPVAWRATADGRLLMLDVKGPELELWEVDPGLEYRRLTSDVKRRGLYLDCAASPDGGLLAAAAERGIELRDGDTGSRLAFLSGAGGMVRFTDDRTLLVLGRGGLARWPIRPGASDPSSASIGPPEFFADMAGQRGNVHFGASADGRVVAIPRFDSAWVKNLEPSDTPAVRLGPHEDVRYSAVSPDGRLVATGSWSGGAKVWNSRTGAIVADLPTGPQCQVAFSPDGRWLATSGDGGQLWRVGTFERGLALRGLGTISSGLFLAFSPLVHTPDEVPADRSLLALAQSDGVIRLIDVEAGRDVAELTDPDQLRVHTLRFAAGGTRLLAASHDDRGAVHVWDLRRIRTRLVALGLDWDWPRFEAARREIRAPRKIHVVTADEPSTEELARADIARCRAEHLADPKRPSSANNLAWALVTAPVGLRRIDEALSLAEMAHRGATTDAERAMFRNTLGLVYHRAGRHRDAIRVLRPNIADQVDVSLAHDLYLLALSYHGAGEPENGRMCLAMAARWLQTAIASGLSESYQRELAAFHAEAAALLGDVGGSRPR